MNWITRTDRRRIFIEELNLLKKKERITTDIHEKILQEYEDFYFERIKNEQESLKEAEIPKKIILKQKKEKVVKEKNNELQNNCEKEILLGC